MAIRTRIEGLRRQLSEPDLRLWQAFLVLYEFIDETPGASLGWFGVDPNALERVPFATMLGAWSKELREHALANAAFPRMLEIADLGGALSEAHAADSVSAGTSLQFVTVLLVIEHAYRGLHPAEVSADDTMHFAELRTMLRKGESLFPHERLRVYTRPRRAAGRTSRGQPDLNSLLRHLVVAAPPANLKLTYACYFPLSARARGGFRRIGIVPTVAHARELQWTRDGDNRYRVEIEPAARAAISTRVQTALAELVSRRVDLVVLPELVGAEWLDQFIADWMASQSSHVRLPALVVAGTWLAPDESGRMRNRAHVLGAKGELAWTQDKLHAYTFRAEDQDLANYPLGTDDLCHRTEAIAVDPRKLTIVDLSSSQRVVLLTCEDFAQEEPHTASIRALQATLVLVPVMAPGRAGEDQTWLHRRGMDYVQQPGAASVVANSGALVVTHQGASASYAQVLADPRVKGVWEGISIPGERAPMAWFIDLDREI